VREDAARRTSNVGHQTAWMTECKSSKLDHDRMSIFWRLGACIAGNVWVLRRESFAVAKDLLLQDDKG